MNNNIWSDEAREAVARAIANEDYENMSADLIADAVLDALSVRAVPRAAIDARIAELDLRADQGEPWPWGDLDPTLEARAAELRALTRQEVPNDDAS